MRIQVVSIFGPFFDGPLKQGLVGKALGAGRASVSFVDPRSHTQDRHRTVDDAPYGGGAGMVMKPEPVVAAIEEARSNDPKAPVVLMSPQGRPLRQADLQRWSQREGVILVAGRYEGFDERIRGFVDEEISLGDFVLTGGEHAALAIIDGVVRLLPGTLGNESSAEADSFSRGLLEHPHYTRPPEFRGEAVPNALRSGHHAEVARWRHARALERTRARRPDLLAGRAFDRQERAVLVATETVGPPLELALGLPPDVPPERLARLLAVGLAYGASRVALVARPHSAALEASVDALSPPLAQRLERTKPKRPKPPWVPEDLDWASRTTVYPDWAAWHADRLGTFVVGASPWPWSEPPTRSPQALWSEGRAAGGLAVVLGTGTEGPEGPASFIQALMPTVRVGARWPDLPLEVAAGALLDRLVGEG